MEQKPLSPPQEKSVSGKPSAAQVKQQILQIMREDGINPQQLITLGQMAEKALSDPSLFQVFKQQMIGNDHADESDFEGNNKYKFIALMSTLGKVTEQMVSSGELRG